MHRGYANDAGWDLYNYKVEEIAPSIWKVHTACRVKISPGYFGLIKERSSALLSNGKYYPTIIQGGVIDAGFEGEISIILYSLRTYCDLQLVYCGRYTHQLIILPCSCSNVVGFKDRPENAGFGSSTGSYNF